MFDIIQIMWIHCFKFYKITNFSLDYILCLNIELIQCIRNLYLLQITAVGNLEIILYVNDMYC